jgi:hypothetical protein
MLTAEVRSSGDRTMADGSGDRAGQFRLLCRCRMMIASIIVAIVASVASALLSAWHVFWIDLRH